MVSCCPVRHNITCQCSPYQLLSPYNLNSKLFGQALYRVTIPKRDVTPNYLVIHCTVLQFMNAVSTNLLMCKQWFSLSKLQKAIIMCLGHYWYIILGTLNTLKIIYVYINTN